MDIKDSYMGRPVPAYLYPWYERTYLTPAFKDLHLKIEAIRDCYGIIKYQLQAMPVSLSEALAGVLKVSVSFSAPLSKEKELSAVLVKHVTKYLEIVPLSSKLVANDILEPRDYK